ncbi:MAG: YqeB family protein [Natronosporangium sp.]
MNPAVDQTVVATPRWLQVLIWLGLVALLAGAGWLLQALAGWIASLPWAPFQGVFERVDQLPEPVATTGGLLVGAAAGLVLAHLASRESLSVRVSTEAATITWNGRRHTVPRAAVETVFLDRRELVVLGRTGRELAREPSDQDTDRLAAAFREHGFPWHDGGDPHQHAYRRWVPDLPGLPPGADPLLKARHRALE